VTSWKNSGPKWSYENNENISAWLVRGALEKQLNRKERKESREASKEETFFANFAIP